MHKGAKDELRQGLRPGVPEHSGQEEQATTRWVWTMVHLDTRRDLLTAGFLLCRTTQDQEVEWLADTGASTSLLSLREWEQIGRG